MNGYTIFSALIGYCGIAWNEDSIIGTALPGASPKQTAKQLKKRFGAQPGEPPVFARDAMDGIRSLFNGERTDLSKIRCEFTGLSSFAEKILIEARKIPAGETRTYGDLAETIGDKKLARQVGKVLGQNPLPIIVPCHRIIGANGKLIGFSAPGGIKTKLQMLDIERSLGQREPSLFSDLPIAIKPAND